MIEQNESILKNLKDIQSLRGLLKSEMSISDPQEGKAIATIKVYNDAPVSPDGGDIVFLGVGLRIIIGSEKGMQEGSAYWLSRISKSRPSDNTELRRKYDEGTWFGSREGVGSFPVVTSDEESHGEVLFPGESVIYEIKTSEAELPYLDIRVEGSVSRRHLFHISQMMEALKHWSQPLVNETFHAVDKIDFFSPLIAIANEVPVFGSQTTFADIDKLKTEIEKGRAHLEAVIAEMNKVYPSAPNQKLRDYMKEGIGLYLKSAGMAFDATQKALSSGDMEKMKQAVEEMKGKLLKTDQVKLQRAKLMSQFGIDY